MSISTYQRSAKHIDLKGYCPFADKNDFIELTEWSNGEGMDISICGKQTKTISMTWGEWEALQVCVNYKD